MSFLFKENGRFYRELSEKTGFHKDIIEKIHRLIAILEYVNSNAFLQERLVLKGGTALNLTVFNLPRLSVDLDFDYHSYEQRETVLERRRKVKEILYAYLEREGYHISHKSKEHFALESIVVGYQNNAGNNDNIKLEINYSLRHHIWPTVMRKINTELFGPLTEVRTLDSVELIATKTAALFNRLAARDFYDLYNVVKYSLFSEKDFDNYCKAVVFYGSLSGDTAKLTFSPARVDELKERTIKQDLQPMLVKNERLDLASSKNIVKEFLSNSLVLTSKHKEYLEQFATGSFKPELLFSGNTLGNIKYHPMAIWKTMGR